jgi:hypothetical protein
MVGEWMTAAGLTLHPIKTDIVDVPLPGKGFDFLGYRFEQDRHWPREKSIEKLKMNIHEKTKRSRQDSLEEIIKDVNQVLMGWFEYFTQHRSRGLPRSGLVGGQTAAQPYAPPLWSRKCTLPGSLAGCLFQRQRALFLS